jgi:hypothetical protein
MSRFVLQNTFVKVYIYGASANNVRTRVFFDRLRPTEVTGLCNMSRIYKQFRMIWPELYNSVEHACSRNQCVHVRCESKQATQKAMNLPFISSIDRSIDRQPASQPH